MPPKGVGLSKPKGCKPSASSQPKKKPMKREPQELSLPAAMSQAQLRAAASQLRQQRRVKTKDKSADLSSPNDNAAEMLIAMNTTGMSPNQKAYFMSEQRRIQAEKAEAEASELEGSDEDDEEEVEEEAAA